MTNLPESRLLGGGLKVTVTVCVAVLVGSVVDAAVIMTLPPAGIAEGAVNVVAFPLAVCAGEKDPQFPTVPQVTVQSTPALATSLATAATNLAVSLCTMVLLTTPWIMLMAIGATIVTLVVANTANRALPLFADAVALIVTTGLGCGLGAGTVGGAVKVAGTPLAV